MRSPHVSLLRIAATLAALPLLPALGYAQGSPTGLPSALNVNVTNTPLPVTGVVSGQVAVTNTPQVVVANQPQVVVTNNSANPVPTRDVNNPARQPFVFSASCESNNSNGCNVTSPTVPAGKRLVLQHVNGSIQLFGTTAQVQEFRLFVGSTYLTMPPRLVNSFSGLINYAVNEPVLMFVEPGSKVLVQASGTEIRLIATAFLSGYLVDAN